MSLFSIIEKSDNLIRLNIQRHSEARKEILIYLFVFLVALMGILIIGLSLYEIIYEKQTAYLLAMPIGIAFAFYSKTIFSIFNENSNTDVIFTFDKAEKKIWAQEFATESIEDPNLVGSFSEIASIHVIERSFADNEFLNLDHSFSVKFERNNGSLIQLYNSSVKQSATQVEKDSFTQELGRVREEVAIIKEFLSTNS